MAGGGNSEKGLTLQDAPAAGGVTVERRANASMTKTMHTKPHQDATWVRFVNHS